MAQELPEFIDVRRLVDGERILRGVLGADALTRLPDSFRVVSPVSLELRFSADEPGRIGVTGRLSAELDTVCQRCLNAMRVAIARDVDVVLVDAEPEFAEADEPDDFVVVGDGRWALAEFAEDELILACPMIPAHEQSECPAHVESAPRGADRRKPFAGLADMLAASRRESDD